MYITTLLHYYICTYRHLSIPDYVIPIYPFIVSPPLFIPIKKGECFILAHSPVPLMYYRPLKSPLRASMGYSYINPDTP